MRAPRGEENLRRRGLSAAATLSALALAGAPGARAAPVLSASLAPAEVALGSATTVAGTIAEGGAGLAGATLALQSDTFPFAGFATVARTSSGPDGAFAFAPLRADRNTRLRVVLEGAPAAAGSPMLLAVDPRVSLAARSLGPGRARLTLRVRHAQVGTAAGLDVHWFVRARGAAVFRLAATTRSIELRPGLLSASAVVDPPARRFDYRVCLNPRWEPAMGPPGSHGRCPTRDFVLPAAHAR